MTRREKGPHLASVQAIPSLFIILQVGRLANIQRLLPRPDVVVQVKVGTAHLFPCTLCCSRIVNNRPGGESNAIKVWWDEWFYTKCWVDRTVFSVLLRTSRASTSHDLWDGGLELEYRSSDYEFL